MSVATGLDGNHQNLNPLNAGGLKPPTIGLTQPSRATHKINQDTNKMERKINLKCTSLTFLFCLGLWLGSLDQSYGQTPHRRPFGNRNRYGVTQSVLKDAFLEDNSFVVRIRTSYNHTHSTYCNAIVMEEHLVLSDVSCIKYQGMANIDAKYVHVIAGEPNNETEYEVEQIYINKADPKDPGTELALLKLFRPLTADAQCRQLIRPERNYSIEPESAVRVIGFTTGSELKENRTRIVKKLPGSKYICTSPADINDTPGYQLLRGAPLLHMVDCRQYQLVGIFTKLDTIVESLQGPRKHQDCYVMVSLQMKWYEQVKSLTSLAAKNGDSSQQQPSVIVVSVDDD